MANTYINRELSWLEFNQRVLSEAQRNSLPLMERVKFLAITMSNLDEFFQVRVGGLTAQRNAESTKPDLVGMSPAQQLNAIEKRVRQMLDDSYALLHDELLPELEKNDISFCSFDSLSASQKQQLQGRFSDNIFPLLTPLGCCDDEPLPDLPAMQLILGLSLASGEGELRTVYLPIPESLDRFFRLVEGQAETVVLLEDVIASQVGELFPDESVEQHTCFRITRNGDIVLHEEDVIDLAGEMEDVLNERKTSNAVRLEVLTETPKELL